MQLFHGIALEARGLQPIKPGLAVGLANRQVIQQGPRTGVAEVARFRHHLAADEIDRAGDAGVGIARLGRGLCEQLAHDVVGRLALERGHTREALVESRAEAVDIVARIGHLGIARLLGAHVGGRAHEGTAQREAGVGIERLLGQAEVRQLRRAAQVQHDVVRLDVAVDDPVFLRHHERLGDSGDDAERLGLGNGPVAQVPGERAAADVLHHDVGEAGRLIERGIHHCDDIGMPDAGGELRLQNEAFRQRGILQRKGRGEDLQRDIDAQRLVGGEVNGADAAPTEFANGAATSDDVSWLNFADQLGHGLVLAEDGRGNNPRRARILPEFSLSL